MKKRMAALLSALVLTLSLIPSTALGANINRLTGNDRIVYDAVEKQVMEVAAGGRGSTVFSLPVSAFGVDHTWYTAEELGVQAIVSGGDATQEAIDAMYAMVYYDLAAVAQTLMAAHPYDLYWFDKTAGCGQSFPLLAISNYDGPWKIGFDGEAPVVTMSMSVIEAYAAGSYLVNKDATTAAWALRATPQAIVAANADKSDYEKLVAYRNAICTLVDYDQIAAEDENAPYNDTWQPTWVFDGDGQTNVVCEGYAKAFQYLCDLSDFTSDSVRCYTVTGTMSDSFGSSLHMWNIVAMDDGDNYLVDVTNCDEGNIGADDLLFLKGHISAQNGCYTWQGVGDTVTYQYDESMFQIYTEEELTVSDTDYLEPAGPSFTAAGLSLRDDIGLRFTVNMGAASVKGSYMSFSWGDQKVASDTATLLTDGDYAGNYSFTCPLAAKELADTVHAVLIAGNGRTLAEYDYSADTYLTTLMGTVSTSHPLYALANAVRLYGAAARAYFKNGPAVSVTSAGAVTPTYLTGSMVLSDGDTAFYGKSLLTKSVLRLRLYFTAPEAPAVTVNGAAATVNGADDAYWVDIPVTPLNLLSGYAVTVSGTAISFTVGVTDYLAQSLKTDSDDALTQLMRAIYRYAKATATLYAPEPEEELWGPLE